MIPKQLTKEQRDYIRSERDRIKRKRLPRIRQQNNRWDGIAPHKVNKRPVQKAAARPLQRLAYKRTKTSTEGELTERQKEILHLISVGWPYPNIARAIEMSYDTVKDEVARIKQKLHTRDMLQAVVKAIRQGILPKPSVQDLAITICIVKVKPDVLSWLQDELPTVPEWVPVRKGGQWPIYLP